MTEPMTCSQPVYWRVRGIFDVLEFSDSGSVVGSNQYFGAWAEAPASVKLDDTDFDKLPDIWEFQWFGDLDETATGDPDSDFVTNLEEYTASSNPAP